MQQIPKIIHYCWFGGNPKPQLVLDCIESWKKYCPNYIIMEWNEENFDIHSMKYVEEAYEAKKWAFVSDYVRLHALSRFGGIYLDTDMELLKQIDGFLSYSAFLGYETKDSVATGIIGCLEEHPLINSMLKYYAEHPFYKDGIIVANSGPVIVTKILEQCGGEKLNGKLRTICGCTLFPEKTFYPNGIAEVFNHHPKKSFAYHHYMESWGPRGTVLGRPFLQRLRLFLVRLGRDLIGTHGMYCLSCWLKGIEP